MDSWIGQVRTTRIMSGDPGNSRLSSVRLATGERLFATEYRVYRSRRKYRTEWLDGSPRRLYDGVTVWDFPVEAGGADMGIPVCRVGGNRAVRPYLVDVPPRPLNADVENLAPLSQTVVNTSRAVLRIISYPRSAGDGRRGYNFLVDPTTGYAIKTWYGDSDVESTVWTNIVVGKYLPDEIFSWAGAANCVVE